MKINNKKGFSLVELSIVLIIVALLIAGVISGKSLINNSKMNLINSEFNTLKVALRTYIDNNNLSDFAGITFKDLIADGYLDEYNDYNSANKHYVSKVAGAAWYYEADASGNITLTFAKSSASGNTDGKSIGMVEGKFCKQFGSKFSGVKASITAATTTGTGSNAVTTPEKDNTKGAVLVQCGDSYYDKLTDTSSKQPLKIIVADIYRQ